MTRIDVHHHAIPPVWRAALERVGADKSGGAELPPWSPDAALKALDGAGVDAAVVSISEPGVFHGDVGAAADLARRCNDALADLVATRPRRFGALAVLPLPDVDASLAELARAQDDDAFDGVVLLANYGGRYLGDPAFDPLFDELDRRAATVFVHPSTPPGEDAGLPPFLVDFTFDTTRAIAKLIVSGTAERCGRVRFVMAHAGGAAPYLAQRMEQVGRRLPREPMPAGPRAHLRRFHYDVALSAGPEAVAALTTLVGPERILFGSDWPYVPDEALGGTVEAALALLPPDAHEAIMGGNARRLFPKLAARL